MGGVSARAPVHLRTFGLDAETRGPAPNARLRTPVPPGLSESRSVSLPAFTPAFGTDPDSETDRAIALEALAAKLPLEPQAVCLTRRTPGNCTTWHTAIYPYKAQIADGMCCTMSRSIGQLTGM